IAWESVGAQVVNPINRINDGFLEDKGVTSGVLVPLVAVAGVDCIIVDIQVVVRRGVLVFKNVVSITGVVGVVASVEKSGFTEVVMASVVVVVWAGFGFVVISVTNEAFAVERLSTVEEASIVVEEETFSKKDSVVLSVKMSLVVAFTAKGMGSVVLAVENRVVVVCPVKRGVVVTSAVKEVDVGVAWDNLFASVAMKVGRISVEKGTVVVLVVERTGSVEDILLFFPVEMGSIVLAAKNCVVVGRKVPGVVVVEAMDNVLAFVPMEMVKMVLCEGEMGNLLLTDVNGVFIVPAVEGVLVVVIKERVLLFSVGKEMGYVALAVENGKVVVFAVKMDLVVFAVKSVTVVVLSVKEIGFFMLAEENIGLVSDAVELNNTVLTGEDTIVSLEGMPVLLVENVALFSVVAEEIGVLVVAKEDMLLSVATEVALEGTGVVLEVVENDVLVSVSTDNGCVVLVLCVENGVMAEILEENGRAVAPTVENIVVVFTWKGMLVLVEIVFFSFPKEMGCIVLVVKNGKMVGPIAEEFLLLVVVENVLVSLSSESIKGMGVSVILVNDILLSEEGMVVLATLSVISLAPGLEGIGVLMVANVKSGTMFLTAEDGMGVVLEVVENGLLVSVSADEVGTLVVFVCDASVLPLKETEVWVVEENVMASLTVVAEILVENGRAVAPAVKGIGVVVNEDNSLVSLDIGTDSVVLAVINVELSLVKLKLVDVALVKVNVVFVGKVLALFVEVVSLVFIFPAVFLTSKGSGIDVILEVLTGTGELAVATGIAVSPVDVVNVGGQCVVLRNP
uniref:Uncharacterized protein n=1 Tax=Latimeria chalumnae TaxID=7897 RepID=H3BB83_LATCH